MHKTITAITPAEPPIAYRRCPICQWGTPHAEALDHHFRDDLCGLEDNDRLRACRTADLQTTGIEWGGR